LVEVWTCNESKLICHSERTNTALKWENKKKHHTRRQINKTTTRHLGDENTKNNNSKNVSNTYLDKWWKKSLLTSRGFFFLVIFFLLPHPIELFLYVGVGINYFLNNSMLIFLVIFWSWIGLDMWASWVAPFIRLCINSHVQRIWLTHSLTSCERWFESDSSWFIN
jgi:hypothetical protein